MIWAGTLKGFPAALRRQSRELEPKRQILRGDLCVRGSKNLSVENYQALSALRRCYEFLSRFFCQISAFCLVAALVAVAVLVPGSRGVFLSQRFFRLCQYVVGRLDLRSIPVALFYRKNGELLAGNPIRRGAAGPRIAVQSGSKGRLFSS